MLKFINTLSRTQKAQVFLAVDLMLVPIAVLCALIIQTLPGTIKETLLWFVPVFPYLLFSTALITRWLGLPNIQLKAYERHAIGLTAVLAISVGAAAGVLTWVTGVTLPLGTYVQIGLFYFLLAVAARFVLLQIVSALYRRAQQNCRVLIYGAGTTGTLLARALRDHHNISPIAFVDDNPSLEGVRVAGLPVHTPARLTELSNQYGIQRVLLAMPSLSQPKLSQIARRVQQIGLDVQAIPSFAQLIGEEELVKKLTPITPQSFLGRTAHDLKVSESCKCYTGRSVMVSGAGGSIGAELCRQLLACGPARLVLYELSELALYTVHQELTQLDSSSEIEIVPVLGSVTDPRQVADVLAHHAVEVVLHAAAYKHVPLVEANPLPGLENNVLGTHVLARAAASAGVERFILISSDKAVRPTNVMGASKRLAELVVQDLSARNTRTVFSMVRFGNVLGSSGSVVPLFQEQVSQGGPVTVTDANVKRFFMTAREAVQLVLKAGSEAKGGEVFVLDMGEPISILHLARQVIESAGYSVRDAATPEGDIEIKFIGLRPGEKIEEELALSGDLLGTRHRKIFCAREDSLSEIEVASMLRNLHEVLDASDIAGAHALLQRWVESNPTAASRRKDPITI